MSAENNVSEPLSLEDSFSTKKFTPKKKRNFFNVKEGDNIYLPLPPFGSLAEQGRWIVKSPTHWGFTINGVPRPFACPGFGCAKCAYDKGVRETLEKVNPKTDPELHAILKGYTDVHSLNITYDMNVLSQTNQIGLLKIKSKMFQSLQIEEKNVAKYGIKSASMQNGTWINFKKTGSGSTGNFTASAVREDKEIEGTIAQVLRKTPITQDVINRMAEEAFDLSKVSTQLTHDQVKTLVSAISDYEVDQTVVDQVFMAQKPNGQSQQSSVPVSAAKNPNDPLSKYF